MIKFWKEWSEADLIGKTEKVKIIVKTLQTGWNALDAAYDNSETKMSLEDKEYMKAQFLNSYFTDLEDFTIFG